MKCLKWEFSATAKFVFDDRNVINDYVSNNIRANSTKLGSIKIKMKLISNNIKIKPNTRLSNRTHETLFVIFILFWVNLLNCECFWQLKLSRKQTFFLFMFSQTDFIFMLFETNFVFMLFALMLFGNSPVINMNALVKINPSLKNVERVDK